MASVTFEGVDKVFPGGARAVDGLTLAVGDGELVVVVGPSGCGKSTVLRLVAGLEEPTAGTLRIGAQVVNGLRPQERNVAMVFQDYALYPHLTVRGNLEFPLKMRRLGHDERARLVARVADVLDIGALLDRLPRALSGGQRQRVAMGRALVREPAVFLLDEPLSNLDARLRVQVRAEIKALQRRLAATMLYVTHDQVEAMTLGDRVVVLHQGRLQQVASPRELYDAPVNTFVAGFVGNPPMNVLPATLGETGGGLVLDVGGQRVPFAYPAARAHVGRVRSMGIRPEAVTAADDGALAGTVAHVEYLGHETLAHVTLSGSAGTMVARLPGMPALEPGAALRLGLDAARLRLFDAAGRAL